MAAVAFTTVLTALNVEGWENGCGRLDTLGSYLEETAEYLIVGVGERWTCLFGAQE